MSWRGTEGGKAAIAAGRKAIMTPNEYCYIDTAQDFPENEPLAFGNYLSLNTIYSYNPTEGLADASLLMASRPTSGASSSTRTSTRSISTGLADWQ
ncbi:MAG: family 20 glycosylhydrolase [Bacteroidales bacterium]|nr:family 20 glycosylhydrolase [Candidatus Cryptobacteroides faecihippi]